MEALIGKEEREESKIPGPWWGLVLGPEEGRCDETA